jgi:hypothetical protein
MLICIFTKEIEDIYNQSILYRTIERNAPRQKWSRYAKEREKKNSTRKLVDTR